MFEIYSLIKEGKVVYVGIKKSDFDVKELHKKLIYDYIFIIDSFESFEDCFLELEGSLIKNKLVDQKDWFQLILDEHDNDDFINPFGVDNNG